MSTYDRVVKITAEYLGVNPVAITAESDFVSDLGADSLDTIELAMQFEQEFGVVVNDEIAKKLLKIKDAVAFIDGHISRTT